MLAQVHAVMPAVTKETGVLLRFLAAIRRIPLTIVKDQVETGDYFRENLQTLREIIADPYVAGSDIIGEELNDPCMGVHCAEKSRELAQYYAQKAELLGVHFMDANGCEFNKVDYMHLTKKGHATMAEELAKRIPELIK